MPELRASLVLDANAQDLDREVRRATRIVDRFGREVRSSAGAQRDSARSTERQSAALRRYARRAHQAARSTRRLDLATQRLDTGLGRLAPLAAGAGLALLARAALGTIQSFESLRATLETFSDSQRQAADRWESLSEYARRTPFELEDVVRAYGVLVSRGLKPTQAQIETLAEIAAGSSRTYVQFAEAVADAVQGETERLKEFGIRLQLDGERATLSFRDTRLEVARTGPAILAALEKIARLEFGGAVERQARTLGGALSTLRGNLSEVSDAVGRGGLAAALNELARGWAVTADGTRETAREFGALAGLAVRHADTIGLVAGGYVAYRINLALAARAQVFYARALGDSSRGLRGYLGFLRRASRHTRGFAVVARSAARAVGPFAAAGIALGLVAWATQAFAAREETRRWREELDETARSLGRLGRGALEARAERTREALEETQASIGRRESLERLRVGGPTGDRELQRLRFEEHRLELANAAAALALARRRQRQTEEDLEAARARPDRNAAEIAAIEAELARHEHERETAIAAGERARERFLASQRAREEQVQALLDAPVIAFGARAQARRLQEITAATVPHFRELASQLAIEREERGRAAPAAPDRALLTRIREQEQRAEDFEALIAAYRVSTQRGREVQLAQEQQRELDQALAIENERERDAALAALRAEHRLEDVRLQLPAVRARVASARNVATLRERLDLDARLAREGALAARQGAAAYEEWKRALEIAQARKQAVADLLRADPALGRLPTEDPQRARLSEIVARQAEEAIRARQEAEDALKRQVEGLGLLEEGGLEVVDSLRQAWSDWAEDGRLDVDRLVDHMKARFAELLAERLIFGPLEELIRGAGSGGGGGSGGGSAGFFGTLGGVLASVFHEGGTVGRTAASARLVPLGPNERLVIREVGETVLPRGERPTGGDLHVQIQIENQSGTPIAVDAVEQRRIEGGARQLVIGLVTDDAAHGGETARALDAHQLSRRGVVV